MKLLSKNIDFTLKFTQIMTKTYNLNILHLNKCMENWSNAMTTSIY